MYQPKPIDTTNVELDLEILKLSQVLAENVHELWAKERLENGSKYGKERNDSLKTHPCLIPYDQLPESEKVYDQITATETLKVIQKLGFTIVPTE